MVGEQEEVELEALAGVQESLLSCGMWHLLWECPASSLVPLRAFGA